MQFVIEIFLQALLELLTEIVFKRYRKAFLILCGLFTLAIFLYCISASEKWWLILCLALFGGFFSSLILLSLIYGIDKLLHLSHKQ